ncbi:MAG: hypothetical protein IJ870_04350 [Alphaproteobacteria bacterium]|nr:hypothetical protein [Alphaproteobacteria bacterium]
MKKNALLFFVFCVLLSAFVFGLDKGAKIVFQSALFHVKMPMWLGALVFGLCACVLFLIVAKMVEALKNQMHENMLKVSGTRANMKMKKSDVDEALLLLLKTMTATTEGDLKVAREHLKSLQKIIGKGAMSDFLELKILKGEKNFDAAQRLSLKLSQNKESELVGLKSLIETSAKKKDFEKALQSANRAFETRQDLYWVVENTFHLRARASDWRGALEVLETGLKKKMVDKERYMLLKAIAYYETGLQEKKEGKELGFIKYVTQAYHVCPSFEPAALDLALIYEKEGQIRKAEKLLKQIWRINPTYDVAKAYLKLFKDDSPLGKVQKMESFALLNTKNPSLNSFVLAELDMKAKLYDKAHAEFEIFLINNPATKKIAKLIAQYERVANHNEKAALNWEKREMSCGDDCLWVCSGCGQTSSKWKPFCSKCGKFDPFEWVLCLKEKK